MNTQMPEIPVLDFSDKFIIPGMCDMHVHAPRYGFRGLGMLLDCNSEWETWFDRYSFPEESRYAIWNMQTKLMAALLTIC